MELEPEPEPELEPELDLELSMCAVSAVREGRQRPQATGSYSLSYRRDGVEVCGSVVPRGSA